MSNARKRVDLPAVVGLAAEDVEAGLDAGRQQRPARSRISSVQTTCAAARSPEARIAFTPGHSGSDVSGRPTSDAGGRKAGRSRGPAPRDRRRQDPARAGRVPVSNRARVKASIQRMNARRTAASMAPSAARAIGATTARHTAARQARVSAGLPDTFQVVSPFAGGAMATAASLVSRRKVNVSCR